LYNTGKDINQPPSPQGVNASMSHHRKLAQGFVKLDRKLVAEPKGPFGGRKWSCNQADILHGPIHIHNLGVFCKPGILSCILLGS
jgi:hypothetical protein